MASEEFKQAPPRRARNSLSREVILDAALTLAQSGADLSTRNVAAELGCSAMALYRHFPDKQDLLLGLLDRVIGAIHLGDDSQPWNVRLLNIAQEHLRTLQSNPWAIPLLFQYPDPGPAVRKVGEAILSALKQGGATGDQAIGTFSSILALNYGWAGFTSRASDPSGPVSLSQKLGSPPSPKDGIKTTAELWGEFEKLGSPKHHEMAVNALISSWL